MKQFVYVTSLLLLLAWNSRAQEAAMPADGRRFQIEILKDGQVDSKETLVFEKGMMDPLDCHQWGFTAATYQAKATGGMISWMSTCKSEKEGVMAWQGKITGDKIAGTMIWTKSGQAPIHYTYSGEETKSGK